MPKAPRRTPRKRTPLPKPLKPFTAAEFFAGIGLVRLALEKQNWKVLFANDIDPDKLEMYEANFGSDHFHLGDIHKIDVRPHCWTLIAHLSIGYNSVHPSEARS